MPLTAEELLAGSTLTHEVEIPAELLSTNGDGPAELVAHDLVQLAPQGVCGPVPLASFPLKRFILSVIY